jgi:hypothetical protein
VIVPAVPSHDLQVELREGPMGVRGARETGMCVGEVPGVWTKERWGFGARDFLGAYVQKIEECKFWWWALILKKCRFRDKRE